MKTTALTIDKVNFNLIRDGKKKNEWRSPSQFNKKRLLKKNAKGLFDGSDIEQLEQPHQENAEAIRNLKKQLKGKISANQTPNYFSVWFKSYDDKAAFLESLGINGDETIIGSETFLSKLKNF